MQYYRGGLSASFGVNSGFSKTSFSKDTAGRTSRLGINVNLAYAINETFLTGVELNAWSLTKRQFFNFESGVNTPESTANDFLVNSSIFAQAYPFTVPFYFKAGIGPNLFLPIHNNQQNDKGLGFLFGVGYEKTWNGLVGLGLSMNYNFGKLNTPYEGANQQSIARTYDVINLGLNFIVF